MVVKIKNISGEVKQLHIHEFAVDEILDIDNSWYIDSVITAVSNSEFEIHDENGAIAGVVDQLRWLEGSLINTVITDTPPFARPDFRTKMSASASIAECAINSSTNMDFQIAEERYISGGSCSIKNAKFGDYITAEVYDKDSVIPEAYRENLCEDWPCVAKYIEKRWVLVDDDTKNINIFFDTYPLNAKISAGLYLRITYNAINEGSTREVVINYNLTKQL